jgi:L-iditol 2-dehydrogenase
VLPSTLNPLYGAFCEPLACTLHGLDLGAPKAGERVIVLGGGVIGQLAVQLAKLAGAEVMLVNRQASKRRLAEKLGASVTAATMAQARALWPQGANLVLECAGVPETVAFAPALCAAGGRVVILGVLPQGAKIEIEPFDLLFREISLLYSFLNPFTQARAAGLIASGLVQVAPLISRQIPLDQAVKAISQPPLPDDVKVLILP